MQKTPDVKSHFHVTISSVNCLIPNVFVHLMSDVHLTGMAGRTHHVYYTFWHRTYFSRPKYINTSIRAKGHIINEYSIPTMIDEVP